MELRSLRYFVAVATDLTVRGAAERLHVSQPPLSRAIQQLEVELGAELFTRSSRGMALTDAGTALLLEAQHVLDRVSVLPGVVARASGTRSITIGTLADSVEHAGRALIDQYRSRYPGVEIRVVEGDLTDPTIGLKRRLTDVALTRGPFAAPELAVANIRTDPVGALVRDTDPLATRSGITLADLAERQWFVLPEATDTRWRSFWAGSTKGVAAPAGVVVRTVREAVQSVLWSGTVGLAPMTDTRHPGLTTVPVSDAPPSPLVVAWRRRDHRALVQGFVELATTLSH
jgi:DNA-binding transcriptional LysR family regulator